MKFSEDESLKHRLWTGRAYKEWMRQNGISQRELQDRAYKENLPLHNSSISLFQRGTSMPKPEWFMYLGEFNEHIDLFTDMDPFYVYINEKEVVAKDYHFFRLFTGSLEIPERYLGNLNSDKSNFSEGKKGGSAKPARANLKPSSKALVSITQEDVDHWQTEIRLAFKEIVKDQCRFPKDVWIDIKKELFLQKMSLEDVEWLQEMIFEIRDSTVEEATRQRQRYKHTPLLTALKNVSGNNQERLKNLAIWLGGTGKEFPDSFPKVINGLTPEQISVLEEP